MPQVVLTKMCVLGGCASHRAIADECKHCGNYRSEIERRRAIPLADGSGRNTFDEAQADLDAYAAEKGWTKV